MCVVCSRVLYTLGQAGGEPGFLGRTRIDTRIHPEYRRSYFFLSSSAGSLGIYLASQSSHPQNAFFVSTPYQLPTSCLPSFWEPASWFFFFFPISFPLTVFGWLWSIYSCFWTPLTGGVWNPKTVSETVCSTCFHVFWLKVRHNRACFAQNTRGPLVRGT